MFSSLTSSTDLSHSLLILGLSYFSMNWAALDTRASPWKFVVLGPKMVKLFVYGTLRSDGTNSYVMQSSTFLGKAVTCKEFPLITASPFNWPFLLNQPGTGHYITGEVYEVSSEKLLEIDSFEEVPILYDRISEDVEIKHGSLDSEMRCIETVNMYALNNFNKDLLEKEMMSDYSVNTEAREKCIEPDESVGSDEEILAMVLESVKAKWSYWLYDSDRNYSKFFCLDNQCFILYWWIVFFRNTVVILINATKQFW